jgi:hypothetical protein
MDNSDNSNKNFFKHVFNFDDESKSDILNIIQYALLAIIPIIILNKTIGKYVPEAEDTKGSLEITAEIIIQIIVTFIGLLITHRMITFVPTYSGENYPEFNIIFIILAVLMIVMSLQTKIGEKVSILVDRVLELWNGSSPKKNKNNKNNIKVSQPISGQSPSIYTDGTAISSLPTNEVHTDTTSLPNYDAMYKQDTTQAEGFGEPMAANAALGGSGFGSSW